MQHFEAKDLYLQENAPKTEAPVKGEDNPAHLGTKYFEPAGLEMLLKIAGVRSVKSMVGAAALAVQASGVDVSEVAIKAEQVGHHSREELSSAWC